MKDLPILVSIGFIAITILTTFLFFRATRYNIKLLLLILALATYQALLGINGFFLDAEAMPPRLIFIILPALVLGVLAFITPAGRKLLDGFNMEAYTWLHTIRVGVELVILSLFLHHLMPESMSFEGRNFDILSGLTAPFIAWWGYRKKQLNKKVILWWNILCLGLVLQVVITGILSAPSAFQQLAFDQPNVAVLYFPFVWLPGIVVPIVIFGHLVAIRQVLRK